MFYTPLPSFFICGGGGGVDSWVFRQTVERVVLLVKVCVSNNFHSLYFWSGF